MSPRSPRDQRVSRSCLSFFGFGFFVGDGEEDIGGAGAAGDGVFGGVGEVIADLVGDAKVFAVVAEDIGDFIELTGGGGSAAEGDFEGWCRFLAEDIEDFPRFEGEGIACPEELGSLTPAEAALAFGGGGEALRFRFGGKIGGSDEAVTFADEEVAKVERDGGAVLLVGGGLVVAGGVAVLDVVVNEGGFVETLDCCSELFH